MIWCCPGCRGQLETTDSALICEICGTVYEVVDDIPDLRHPSGSPDYAADRDEERRMLDSKDRSPERLVRSFFAAREVMDGWTEADTETRTRQTLISPARLRGELDGWLNDLLNQSTFLDLGCGLGGLLSAAATAKARGIGIDNRMTVLVVAKRLIESNGGEAVLACARAEAMPLANRSLGGVVMYDVVEHVDNLEQVLAEISRVTAAGGILACSTPNRFSIAPEPHVHLWGVGWLPRRLQAGYVKRVSGRSYEGTRLLSPGELASLVRRHTGFDPRLELPEIPAAEMAVFKGPKKILGRIYNALAHFPLSKPVLLRIGAFFQLVAVRRA